jgi:integrase/recombinase XerD
MTRDELAANAYLSRYSGATRDMYRTDLRIFFDWCAFNRVVPLEASRMHLEFFSRYLEEERGNRPASVHRRLSTVRGFYRIAVADEWIDRNPSEYLRMPKVRYDETRTLGLDRIELGNLIQTARATSPRDAALVSLMGMLGLRVSETCAVNIEDYSTVERGHRVLFLVGKGDKPATIPVPVPLVRTLDQCADGRTSGPLILRRDGKAMDRRTAYRRVQRLCKLAGIEKPIGPHSLRHSAITAALDAGVPLRDAQVFARHSDPRTTTRYDRGRMNLDRHASYIVAGFLAGAA